MLFDAAAVIVVVVTYDAVAIVGVDTARVIVVVVVVTDATVAIVVVDAAVAVVVVIVVVTYAALLHLDENWSFIVFLLRDIFRRSKN